MCNKSNYKLLKVNKMKRTYLVLLGIGFCLINLQAQNQLTGTIKDRADGSPVPYATAALLRPDSTVITGVTTNDLGLFVLENVSDGDYILQVSFIGYEKEYRAVNVPAQRDLGDILIKEDAIGLDEVVVKGQRVVRMSDRFIVNLANDPTAVGRTGSEILNLAPGVFIQERDGSISINGKGGTKVYINERPLHLSGTDLIRYLQTIKAEDIIRIEILPNAGAEYDANITGGIIKITMKRQREDGMNGSVGISYSSAIDEDVSLFTPSLNLNFKHNKLTVQTMLNYDKRHHFEQVTEETEWTSSGRNISSNFDVPVTLNTGRARVSAVYDFNDKQSVGVEAYYFRDTRKNKSFADLVDTIPGNRTDVTSKFDGKLSTDFYSFSANYLWWYDNVGSWFLIKLDYLINEAEDNQNYWSEFRNNTVSNYDTTYRSNMLTDNKLYIASVDLLKRFNDHTWITIGGKYGRSEMDNKILYQYLNAPTWNEIEPYSSLNSFSENIAAGYAKFNSKISKISYSIGLRGEYTEALPWTNKSNDTEKQNYFKLFPSLNLMLPFDSEGNISLVFDYNRKIRRPTFANLNPFRLPGSEYTYIAGNPKLKPALSDDYSISLRLFHALNLTAGITDTKDAFGKVWISDPDAPGVIIQTTDNIAKSTSRYLVLSMPINPSEWWQININLNGRINTIEVFDDKRKINTFYGYMSNTFTLPNQFLLDLNGYYQSPFLEGSVKTTIDPNVNISLRKQFFEGKISTSIHVNNVFDIGTAKVEAVEKDFNKNLSARYSYREFGFSLRYNFQAGKNVNAKAVYTGANEEKVRLETK